VRLDGRRSARWEDLGGTGRVAAILGGDAHAPLRLPTRDVLVAHALVHALAQHGLAAAYPGWLLVGDLIDLAAEDALAGADGALVSDWLARDLSAAEIDAALALARRAAAGDDLFAPAAAPPARLACHFTACALDPAYAAALKARWLEAPVSDRGRIAARLRLVAHAFVPPVRRAPGGAPERGLRRFGRWLARPIELALAALRAARQGRARDRLG
jgi:hypothetical protein